jgi:iron complex transport system ATP-binding protein
MLKVKHLSVRYGDAEALHDVSFSVQSGEWVMVTGPNGAGKSTMLEALIQSVPYTGQILLGGADARTLKPRERARRMGLLSQRAAAGCAFTVEEVVRLGRYAWHSVLGGPDAADEAAVEDALHQTGMAALRDQPVSQVSGGEAQRALLAQLFAQSPSLLLLDEPSSHLDLYYQQQLFSLIEDWRKKPGRAVLSVVHDLALVRRFGTRVIVLNRGRIEADGPPEKALSPKLLQTVYGMDAAGWMRELYEPWNV